MAEESAKTAPRPRGKRRWLLRITLGAAALLVLLIALAPWIASRLAPGIVESAAASSIQGSVKVSTLSIGWFSPLRAGPVQLLDPSGKPVASVQADAPITLWTIVRNRWWSASSIDLGTINVRGEAALVRRPDGSTNLDDAIAPRAAPGAPGKGAGTGKSASGVPDLKLRLNIAQLEATVREQQADGTLGPELGVKQLAGKIDAALDQRGLTAGAELKARAIAGDAASDTAITFSLDARERTPLGAAGLTPDNLERINFSLEASGVPSALVDAFAGLAGALQAGLGDKADVAVRIQGDARNATINLLLDAPEAQASATLKLVDGVLQPENADKPALVLSIDSTTFLANLPQASDLVAQMRDKLTLDDGPSVRLVVGALHIPVPVALLEGQPFPPAELDLRGAGAMITLNIGAASGSAAIPGPDGAPQRKPFRAEPLQLTIDATDLAAPLRIRGSSAATIEGRSAGALAIDLTASDLLDSNGRLRALRRSAAPSALPATIAGSITLDGASTALLQPFAAATGLPLELAADVGPSIDLSLSAQTDAPAAQSPAGAIPPTQLTLAARAQNLQADAALRIEGSTLTTTGQGVRVRVNSAAPLASRLLAPAEGGAAPLAIDGRAAVELAITGLNASLDAIRAQGENGAGAAPLAAADAQIAITVSDAVAILPASDESPAQRIDLRTARLGAQLARGSAPRITLSAEGMHDAAPVNLAADLTASGLASGVIPTGSPVYRLLALGLAGKIEAGPLPVSLMNMVPQVARYAPASQADRSELDAAIARVVQGAVGNSASATVTLTQPQGGAVGQVARVQVTTQSQGAGADLWLRLLPQQAALTGGNLNFVADPGTVNAVLRAAAPPAEGESSIELGARTKVWVRFPEPIIIPLKRDSADTISPDFAAAGGALVQLAAEGDVVASGIPIGSDPGPTPDDPPVARTTTLRVHKLAADLRAPLAALAEGAERSAHRGTAKLTAEARTADSAPLASIGVDAAAALDGSAPRATVTLADLNTANADALLGRPGLVSGALGNTARATVNIEPVAGAAGELSLRAELVSPAFKGADIALVRRADRVMLAAPAAITWSPAPAFVNSFLSSEGRTLEFTHIAPIDLRLTRLTIAQGAEGVGPLLPGVFDLDAQFNAPQLGMTVQAAPAPGPAAAAPAQPRALAMERLSGRVRWDPAVPGTGGAGAGAIDAAMTIGAVTGTSGATAEPSRISAKLRSIADKQGNLRTERAIIDADADLKRFPTIVIDEFAAQDGLLAELLGPEVSVAATARSLTRVESGPRGLFEATLTSPRADAHLVGDIRRGRFVQTGPSRVRVVEIRPQLVDELAGGLPLVASMEKSASDEPAIIELNDLVVPLDQNMSRLSGTISVDLGVARFTTSSFMGSLLKAVGGRAEGQLGRKIDPFVVRIDKGVATYERFRLPLGEFSIETKGQVDLVKRTVNLTTYVPFFAITDEAMGPIRLGLGGRLDVLDRNTLVPISIKGGMSKPSAMIDAELFLRETAGNIIQQPGRIIEGLGDLLGGKKKNEEPEKK